MALSAMVGRQLPFFSLIIPAYLVVLLAGWRAMVDVLPAVLIAGVSFAAVQFVVSNFVGPELTDTLAALCSLGALALLLRVWRPRDVEAAAGPVSRRAGVAAEARGFARSRGTRVRDLRHPRRRRARRTVRQLRQHPQAAAAGERHGPPAMRSARQHPVPRPVGGGVRAAAPQGFRFPVWDFQWPGSYTWSEGRPAPLIRRAPPVADAVTPYPLTYRLDFLASAGTLVFMAGLVAFVVMLVCGVPPIGVRVGVRAHRRAAAPARRDDRVHPVDRDRHELLRA